MTKPENPIFCYCDGAVATNFAARLEQESIPRTFENNMENAEHPEELQIMVAPESVPETKAYHAIVKLSY